LGDVELTVRAVAERLRISTATVYALCRTGELQHHRISHAIRISERLAEYLEGAGRRARRG
jgi:excisionase family DNA binding protein